MVYHITPTGQARECRATRGNCPYGGPESHFSNKEIAQKAFELRMESTGAHSSTLSKKGSDKSTLDISRANAAEIALKRAEKAREATAAKDRAYAERQKEYERERLYDLNPRSLKMGVLENQDF